MIIKIKAKSATEAAKTPDPYAPTHINPKELLSKPSSGREVPKSKYKSTSYSLEEAKALDKQYAELDDVAKGKFLDINFPSSIKSSSITLKNALDDKIAPFKSYLYQILVNYSETSKTGDISNNSAKTLIQNERTLGKLLSKEGVKGLDLSKSDFQLKAIEYITNRGLDITLRKGGSWLSETAMRKEILAHEFSDDEKTKLKQPIEPKSDRKLREAREYLKTTLGKLYEKTTKTLSDDEILGVAASLRGVK